MFNKILFIILTVSATTLCSIAQSQIIDSTSFEINSRLSFYTFEKNGEFLLHVPSLLSLNNLSVTVKIRDDILTSWNGRAGGKIIRLHFPINLSPGSYGISATITTTSHPGVAYRAVTILTILPYKVNEVKTDRLTGGLIVNKRQFFPFGFYCYSPVYPTLPEEEAVRGFNMISPYQKIAPETMNERKAYMDRCAELGMKVNYNLLSVSGGGGVGSKTDGVSYEEKRKRLISEINAFKDHPALLGWYISDEPSDDRITTDELCGIYRVVAESDPWHPVSIVFMAPFLNSKKYINALDIVMADPYPLPDHSLSMAGDIAGQLKDEFSGKRPVWIVPQAFGGGELWSREPTWQEIRSMTWQSIIKGATGIQYFVRQGPNYFPKSPATWDECGKIAMETAELTPWLLSDEPSVNIESYSANVLVTSRMHAGQLLIMAVNKVNEPVAATIRVAGVNEIKARVIFENRSITIKGGILNDELPAYGSQAYLIDVKPENPVKSAYGLNFITDPGFEDNSSPGVPSACYARPGGDRGATYFLDSREHFEGSHSLRIITPQNDKSVTLRFYPFRVKAGSTYSVSIWAKSDPEQRILKPPENQKAELKEGEPDPQYAEIFVGEFGRSRFIPDNEWKQYLTFISIPSDTSASFKTNLILRMPGQGVAWFDQIRVTELK